MAVRFSADAQDYTRTLSWGSTTQWSFTCWVKISTDRNDFSTVWSLDNGAGTGMYLQTDSDGTTMSLADVAVEGAYGARAMTPGTWYYWGVSVNGSAGTIVSRALGDSSFTVNTWTGGTSGINIATLRLGESAAGAEWLNGTLAAVKIYQSNLSQAELEAEAWAYLPRRTAGIAAWYPFTATEAVDYSGNARTLSGGSGSATEDGPGLTWRQGRRRTLTPLSIPAEATPGVIDAPWSVPTPDVSTGMTVAPDVVAAPWTIPVPDVFVGGIPTQAEPGRVEAAWSIFAPTVDAFKNVDVSPATILALASIPTPAVTIPVNAGDDLTGPGQLSYNGFKLGSGTPYPWIQLEGAGLDMPGVDNGNVAQSSAHGSISGRKLSQARIITLTTAIDTSRDQMEQAALDLLNALPLPDADEELPLAIQILGTIYIAYGAVVRRAAPVDKVYRLGRAEAVVQWEMANPRMYSRQLNTATIADGFTVDVFHAGNTTTHPLVRCPGPAHGPMLTLERTLANGSTDIRVIEFDLEVADSETLIIDPINNTVSIGANSKLKYLTGASIGVPDWVLGRGATTVEYATQEGRAPNAVMLWRDAWI